jgi:cyanophycinase
MMIKNTMLMLGSLVLLGLCACHSENKSTAKNDAPTSKGKLFIIGGGERTYELMESLLNEAGLQEGDYIGILPMSSEEPDSAYLYIRADFAEVSPIPCINLHFTESDLINQAKLDSLRKCKLIFITGGDQKRFMNLVHSTPIEEAIKRAYQDGSTIAGTSAGAAVMSEIMITGDENFSEEYSSTYDKIWKGNAIYATGLGMLQGVIIDQHFLIRSRHNRLLTALCDFPGHMGVGIDESTAIVVSGDSALVVGSSQVIVYHPHDSCDYHFKQYAPKDVHCSVLVGGEKFALSTPER